MGDVGNRGKMEEKGKFGKKVMKKCKGCIMLSILTWKIVYMRLEMLR